MVRSDSAESKKHLWRALALLCCGSVLLLCTKLNVPPFWDSVLCLGGGGILLYANGEFLFGLLIHANSDDSASTTSQADAAQDASTQPAIKADH